MVLPKFDYEAPATLGEVLARLAAENGEARVLAGGTDLLVRMKRRLLRPRLLISLGRIRAIDGIETTETGAVSIGALSTMSEIGSSCALPARCTALLEGANAVGGPIIRNRATIGGNIVNARPCADTVPALVALGARLHLDSCAGRRSADIDGFVTGPGQTAIRDDEVLTAIELPRADGPFQGSCYLKITRRAAMEVTIVGCAARVDLEDDARTVRTARLVFASVAPVPLRVRVAEQALEGRIPDDAVIREAASLARGEARPIDDCRAPADFRAALVETLTRRAVRAALDRAKRGAAS